MGFLLILFAWANAAFAAGSVSHGNYGWATIHALGAIICAIGAYA